MMTGAVTDAEIIDKIIAAGKKLGYETEVYFSAGRGINLELKGKLIGEACGSARRRGVWASAS